jgi:hypothetical protein
MVVRYASAALIVFVSACAFIDPFNFTVGGACGPCPAYARVCDEDTGTCVECVTSDDCPTWPHTCNSTRNECDECATDGDCTDRFAPHCAAGVCTGCTSAAQCARFPSTTLCDSAEGSCNECTATDTSACNTGIACTGDGLCSEFGTDQRQCDPCDTDANCRAMGGYCVPMIHQGTIDDTYCLWEYDGTCPGGNVFSRTMGGLPSVDGVTGLTVCTIREPDTTTCAAVRALLDGAMCPSGSDSECPPSGLCRTLGTLTNRCTYPCGDSVSCPSSPGPSTCSGGPPDYCGG